MREAWTVMAGLATAFAIVFVTGCDRPTYDTSTPQQAIEAVQAMVADGHPEQLPTMIHIQARDIVYDDGVTEASAIEDVRRKAGDMLAQLWRVTRKLQAMYPDEVGKELELARSGARARGFGSAFARFLADPFSFLDEQRDRLVAEDLGDGTAALLVDGEPAFGGVLTLVETDDGWRLSVPVEAARSSGYWPDTRHEWAVVASIMLSAETALADFERKLDRGDFRTLKQASEYAGLQLGGSVAVQSVIYASMKEKGPDAAGSGR